MGDWLDDAKAIEELERELFLCRRRIEKAVQASGLNGFYLCSLSARSIVYKGMVRAELLGQLLRQRRIDVVNADFKAVQVK